MRRLGPIRCVTIATPDLAASTALYRECLGYEVVQSGPITAQLATLWQRPQLTGRPSALLLPGGRGNTYLRFVASPAPRDYQPFRHFGWNAAEIMVQDTDAVAGRLTGSGFRVIGPPANLSFTDKIRAMQVLGPAQEALYLTSFRERMPEFDVPAAEQFIDRVFIVIVGGRSVAELNDFYATHLGTTIAPPLEAVISVLSQAHGLPADRKHELAAIALDGQCYIEADAMPSGTRPRTSADGELPPAIAMVSFDVESLDATRLRFRSEPQRVAEAPYAGRRAAVASGAADEWIELIEG
ncbi:MAG: VOC family protein [Steroidobacteraceae bacterium]|nr:VOC family protein [Steroidobacteraceae bacterium]MDW8260640.1 VOC family protein [Gammaproteobacteria bacterium]